MDKGMLHVGAGSSHAPNDALETLFETAREYDHQALATANSSSLGDAALSRENYWWQGLQQLGIDIYPAADDAFHYPAASLPVIQNE